MPYYIMKTEDKSSQIGGIYFDLDEASNDLQPGYTVFDHNGKALIGCAKLTKPYLSRTNYRNTWERLKDEYLSKKTDLDNKSKNGGLSAPESVIYIIYKNLLERMEEIETEETEILGEY